MAQLSPLQGPCQNYKYRPRKGIHMDAVVRETSVTVGKGLDESGAMLPWVRNLGKFRRHDLYRSMDDVTFEKIASPQLGSGKPR